MTVSTTCVYILRSALTRVITVTEDQREALLDLLLINGNQKIAPEIRKELLAGRGRGVPAEPEGPTFDGDDTMLIDS
jgi:essential nuclear protein 1